MERKQIWRTDVEEERCLNCLQEINPFKTDIFCFHLLSIKCLPLSTWHLFKIHWGYFLHHWLWTDFRGSCDRTFSGQAQCLEPKTFSMTCSYQFSFQACRYYLFWSKGISRTLEYQWDSTYDSRITRRKVPMVHILNSEIFSLRKTQDTGSWEVWARKVGCLGGRKSLWKHKDII